jgi:hypothetical protein
MVGERPRSTICARHRRTGEVEVAWSAHRVRAYGRGKMWNVTPAGIGDLSWVKTYKVIGQAGYGISTQALNIGVFRGDLHDMSTQDDRGYTGDGEWASNLLKGECNFGPGGFGTSLVGVSRVIGGNRPTKKIFCSTSVSFNSGTTLDFSTRDDRRSTMSGEWDAGFVKGECPQGQALTALAQTLSGVVKKARCAPIAVTTDSCEKVTLSNGDQRQSIWGGDWSVGDFKAQCADPLVATGVSRDDDGKVRALLCCARHGHP